MGRHRAGKESGDMAGSHHVNTQAVGTGPTREQVFRRYVEPEIEVLLRVAQTLTGSWATPRTSCRTR